MRRPFFFTKQAVYIEHPTLDGNINKLSDLECELTDVMQTLIPGKIRTCGWWVEDHTECMGLCCPDADKLFKEIRHILEASPYTKNSNITLYYEKKADPNMKSIKLGKGHYIKKEE